MAYHNNKKLKKNLCYQKKKSFIVSATTTVLTYFTKPPFNEVVILCKLEVDAVVAKRLDRLESSLSILPFPFE